MPKHLHTARISILLATGLIVFAALIVINQTFIASPSEDTITSEQLAQQPPAESTPEETKTPADETPTVKVPKQPTQEPAPDPEERPESSSEKQEEIRDSVQEEQVYYPLRTANDPGYASSWPLTTMKAPAAWDITTGSTETVVAVIDGGYGLSHDDLIDSWYENTGEMGTTQLGDPCWTGTPQNKQTNNCDDDQNGYDDDWRGWNFVLGDNNPSAGRTNPNGDGVAHGTQVSGLVGAGGNNGIGIATLSWSTKVMPLQALSDDGPGFTSDVAAAVYYAVDNGADVINMSLGGSGYDPALEDATTYAYENNVPVIAASGNCGTGTELGCEGLGAGYITYPARNPHVIAVGATNQSNQRASFSSYGVALDVVAPGSGSINSPTWTQADQTSLYTTSLFGTSFASPYVASLVALIKSIRPDSSVDDIMALVMATTTKPSSMSGSFYTTQFGHGIIDAQQAVTVAQALNTSTTAPSLLQTGGPRSERSFDPNISLGSGCVSEETETYCAIAMRQNSTQHDRFLPYTIVGTEIQAGWTWSSNIIVDGSWDIRAIQGDERSSAYTISRK